MNHKKSDMVQIHMLTAYPASLLNRDDVGLAKRVPFGGATRTRVSSQCLKKHWRESPLIAELGDQAVRSVRIFERLIAKHLHENLGAQEAEAVAIAQWLMNQTVDTKPVDKKKGLEAAQSSQLLVMTKAETTFLVEKAEEALEAVRRAEAQVTKEAEVAKLVDLGDKKQLRDTLGALPSSIDTGLFGRMITSDLLARVDAAVSVAHAFTTHAEAAETDYFTAIDTLKGIQDDAGAGLIQDSELTSGIYYLYAVIDMNQLRDNLQGQDSGLAERLASNLVTAMATVTPQAKRGSTAPFSYAEFVLTERGPAQPRTLANAFLKPVSASGSDLMAESVKRLLGHKNQLEGMYGAAAERSAVSSIHDLGDSAGASKTFQELLDFTFGNGN